MERKCEKCYVSTKNGSDCSEEDDLLYFMAFIKSEKAYGVQSSDQEKGGNVSKWSELLSKRKKGEKIYLEETEISIEMFKLSYSSYSQGYWTSRSIFI